jgi:hypothetical protein
MTDEQALDVLLCVEADGLIDHGNVIDWLLFELDDGTPGILASAEDVERLDEHCAECRDALLPFKVPVHEKKGQSYLSLLVGPTKFSRIRSGWRDSSGLSLRRVVRFWPTTTEAAVVEGSR